MTFYFIISLGHIHETYTYPTRAQKDYGTHVTEANLHRYEHRRALSFWFMIYCALNTRKFENTIMGD